MKLMKTADGSHTLFVPGLDEHYHSVNGAVQESVHVFLRAGFDRMSLPAFRVLEFGFGTGLNALLTMLEADERGKNVVYASIEKYPLPAEISSQLNYGELLCPSAPGLLERLHQAAWDEDVALSPSFTLHKIRADYNECRWPDGVDLVYFDAFAPDKQPEVWNQALFDRIFRSMNDGGVIVTYCAKGAVRRMWQAAGFTVERLPGPPGKREMLRGTKKGIPTEVPCK